MKKFLLLTAGLTLAALLAAPNVFAAPYVAAGGGLTLVEDADLDDPAGSGELSFDDGFGLFAAFGNRYQNLRAEIEVGYRANDLDRVSLDGLGSSSVEGDAETISLMANAFFDLLDGMAVQPFVGGGLGVASVDLEIDEPGLQQSEDDTVFAWQLMAGVGFPLSTNIVFDVQYRFFATADPEFDGTEAEYMTHNVFGGLRYSF